MTPREEPTADEFARELRISVARTNLQFGQTAATRRVAMAEITALKAQRTPAMLVWLAQHPAVA